MHNLQQWIYDFFTLHCDGESRGSNDPQIMDTQYWEELDSDFMKADIKLLVLKMKIWGAADYSMIPAKSW